jgi:predicted DCC family thiol-disulfide oxidoreductase YuxK
VRWIRALDRNHRVTVVPYQKPGVAISVGLSVEQCEEAVWVVEPGKTFGRPWRRPRGAAAIDASLAVALGVRLPLVFYELPGLNRLQDRLYDLVAANRHRLPGDVPYCKARPEECG